MTKDNLELSRRKLLAGVGTAGIAAAGAGLGTTAWLNDQESFTGNTMEAGELDLRLDYFAQYNQSGVVQMDGSSDTTDDVSGTFQVTSGTRDGDAGAIVSLLDVKPGDCGFIVLCPRLIDNPGHLWMRAQQTSDEENGYTEPEPQDGQDPGDPDGRGELDDEMLTAVSYHDAMPSEPLADACAFDPSGPLIAGGGGETSAAATLSALWNGGEGVYLDADPLGEGDTPWPGGEGDDIPCIAFEFHVPETVGNVIQGDSFSFDVEFYAEQARHNPGDNPWATPTPTPTSTQTQS